MEFLRKLRSQWGLSMNGSNMPAFRVALFEILKRMGLTQVCRPRPGAKKFFCSPDALYQKK